MVRTSERLELKGSWEMVADLVGALESWEGTSVGYRAGTL